MAIQQAMTDGGLSTPDKLVPDTSNPTLGYAPSILPANTMPLDSATQAAIANPAASSQPAIINQAVSPATRTAQEIAANPLIKEQATTTQPLTNTTPPPVSGKAELVEQQKATEADVLTPEARVQPTTTATTGTGAKSGTSGISTTTKVGTQTLADLPADASPADITASLDQFKSKMPNQYLDQLGTMKYEYDITQDKQYLSAAAALESQVMQSMSGRGALYSSVAQAKLQSGLIELQVKYEQIAYDKFVAERDWVYKMASFVSDRQDAEFSQNLATANFMQAKQESAFNQNLQMAKFRMDQEQQAFSQKMAIRDQQLQEANAAYNRKLSEAQTVKDTQLASLEKEYNALQTEQNSYKTLYTQWTSNTNGYADKEVAAYFHVQPGTTPQTGIVAVKAKYDAIQAAEKLYQQHVLEYQNG